MSLGLHICGDIGATKTLLAVAARRDEYIETLFERRYANIGFAEFADVLDEFLQEYRAAAATASPIANGCFGVAGPVDGRQVKVTNLPWRLDADALEAQLGAPVGLVNDFEAAAYGVDVVSPEDLVTLQEGELQLRAPQVVIGAGTGLGIAYRFWMEDGYTVIPGEGGHMGFAPADTLQIDLWRDLRKQFGRVTAEHVLCGRGLARIYEFLRAENAAPESAAVREAMETSDPAAVITYHSIEGDDALSRRALDLFLECYGAVAGDHALAVLARGGVYIAGGIAPKLFPRLRTGPFLRAFSAKGNYSDLAARFPVHVVMNERVGLLGAARLAAWS